MVDHWTPRTLQYGVPVDYTNTLLTFISCSSVLHLHMAAHYLMHRAHAVTNDITGGPVRSHCFCKLEQHVSTRMLKSCRQRELFGHLMLCRPLECFPEQNVCHLGSAAPSFCWDAWLEDLLFLGTSEGTVGN